MTRILSVDVLRGLVMVLMAIDHVRVYAAVPAGGPTAGLFFTRWVTHFCAPVFVFLAGTSAFLYGRRLGDTGKLARYLVSRGAVLVLLEMTIVRLMWTFNFDYANYMLAGVIWMIGWCMILLAALMWLPATVVGIVGLAIVLGHNVMDFLPPDQQQALSRTWLPQILYFGGVVRLGEGGPPLAILYSIVPWIGVIAAGYGFGLIVSMEASRRDRWCLAIGAAAIALFITLRWIDGYGDPRHWSTSPGNQPVVFRFLNTTKYPASLLFLLMTLGPAIALVPLAERATGLAGRAFAVFGRVPMFYYLLHIPAIHLAAIVVSLLRDGSVTAWLFANHPMFPPPAPQGYRWSLALLYLVFGILVIGLYVPCRWFARVKADRPQGWMRFI